MATTKTIAKPMLMEEPGAIASPKLDGAGLHVGLVYARQHKDIVDALLLACRGELLLKGVHRSNIYELEVMQAYDLPYAMKRMVQASPVMLDALVCVGCLVRGESLAFDFVAEAVTRATMKVGMKTKTPVIYGVLNCTDMHQARQCAGLSEAGKTRSCNFGVEWAQSAIDMAHMSRKAAKKAVEHCGCDCHSCREGQEPSGKIHEGFEGKSKKASRACGSCGHEEDSSKKKHGRP